MEPRFNVVIAGAGPAGLWLAAALASPSLRVAVIDRQPLDKLSDPAGRSIAANPDASVAPRLSRCTLQVVDGAPHRFSARYQIEEFRGDLSLPRLTRALA